MLDLMVAASAPALPKRTRTSTPTFDHPTMPAPFTRDGSERTILFRVDPQHDEVVGVFPCEPSPLGTLLCFSRPEGFTTRTREWFEGSHPARPEGYRSLAAYVQASLTAITIHHRITPGMDETRRLRPILREREERVARYVAELDCSAALTICEAIDRNHGGLPNGRRAIRAKDASKLAAIYLAGLTCKVPDDLVGEAFGLSTERVSKVAVRMAVLRTKSREADILFGRMERGIRRWIRDGRP